MEMKMVKQPEQETGCGVAVFAMLTHMKFEESLAYLLKGGWVGPRRHHMTTIQMKAALGAYFDKKAVRVSSHSTVSPWSAVYVVYCERYRHWVAFDGKRFFDPLEQARGPSDSIRRKITRTVSVNMGLSSKVADSV